MPIHNRIDEENRIVYSICEGKMELADFTDYTSQIWGDARYSGYNELFDMRSGDWDDFDFSNLFVVATDASNLNVLTSDMMFACVTGEGKAQKLTEFYLAAKGMITSKSRQLEAFETEDEALTWLMGSLVLE